MEGLMDKAHIKQLGQNCIPAYASNHSIMEQLLSLCFSVSRTGSAQWTSQRCIYQLETKF